MNKRRFTLYHFPLSRSARVKWLLHEILDNDFDVVSLALMKGEQYDPAFLQLNPNHAVPVLNIIEEDGSVFTMIESGAMVSFLADAFPEKKLAPPASGYSTERADYLQILHFGTSSMDMMLWQLRLHKDLLPVEERDCATVERYLGIFRREVEPQLTTRLAQGQYMCGDQFTAADCVMAQNINWARAYSLCQDPCFKRYLDKLRERPAYQAAYADRAEFPSA